MSAEEHECTSDEQFLKDCKRDIEKYGLQVLRIPGDGYLPSFSYSIGLVQTYQHPEIICFGLSQETSHQIINDVAALIKGGQRFEHEQISHDIFEGGQACFLKVDP